MTMSDTTIDSSQRSSPERAGNGQGNKSQLKKNRNTEQNPQHVSEAGNITRHKKHCAMNVNTSERLVSVLSGTIVGILGLSRRSLPGLAIAGIGGALVYRGISGKCSLYKALGIDTAHQPEKSPDEIVKEGFHVHQSFYINRSPEELYNYWRNFKNLPTFMSHLQGVEVIDDRLSHWTVNAPQIVGGKVEWDAEIIEDVRNEFISWKSLPGADVDNTGKVSFKRAPGDRGTAVEVIIDYVPPAGRLGKWVAGLFGESPDRQVREDLRKFKRVMEVGEDTLNAVV